MRKLVLCAAMLLMAGCGGPAQRSEEVTEQASESPALPPALPEDAPQADPLDDPMAEEVAAAGTQASAAEAKADIVADAASASAEAESEDVAPESDDKAIDTAPFCAPVHRRLPDAVCQNIKDQQAALEAGVAAFRPSERMERGTTTRVRLAIGAADGRAETARAAGGVEADLVPVKIGRFMSATLSGANFQITPDRDPHRDLGASSSETWEWNVVPEREGQQILQAQVETFAVGDDGSRTRLSIYRSEPIAVAVFVSARDERLDDVKRWEEETGVWRGLVEALTGWAGALAALILALSLIAWRIRRFGRESEIDEVVGTAAGRDSNMDGNAPS